MITLAELAKHYHQAFIDAYGQRMRPEHHFALRALMDCRTPAYGEMSYYCDPCHQRQTFAHSCGHRFYPKCQHQSNSHWLLRQQQKLLPVHYFMMTFTLPYELRNWLWHHQRPAYAALFKPLLKPSIPLRETINSYSAIWA